MKGFQLPLRVLVVVTAALSVFLALRVKELAWLGLLVSLPPMAGLAWRGTVAYLFACAFALGVFTVAWVAMLATGEVASDAWFALGMGLVTLFSARVGWIYLAQGEARRHEERKSLEDLEEQTVNLQEEFVAKEKSLIISERRRRRYSRLQGSATALAASLEVEKLAQVVLEQAADLLGDLKVALSVIVFDAPVKEGLAREWVNLFKDLGAGIPVPEQGKAAEDPLNAWVLGRGATLVIRELEKDFRFRALEGSGLKGRCFYLSPFLDAQGRATGLLRVEATLKDAIEPEDQRLVESLVVLSSLALENAKLYRETQELAVTDGLTKLLLRRPLMERLETEVRRAAQGSSTLSLLMLDIDHFKGVNDTYGHPAGDQVLREVSVMVRRSVRDVDLCGRYGGEEFVVLLPETDTAGAMVVAERICEAVKTRPFELKGERRKVTVSLGVATYPQHALNAHDLIERADAALYASKEGGRDRVSAAQGGPTS